jgi:hypothetical protein
MAQNERKLIDLKPQYEEYKKKEEECTKMWVYFNLISVEIGMIVYFTIV